MDGTDGNMAPQPGNVPVVLRIILACLLLVPGVVGLIVLLLVVVYWISGPFAFVGEDRMWMPLFIIPSVALVLFSVLTVGVILRFARWAKAHVASLWLAIIGTFAIVMGYHLLLELFSGGEDPTDMTIGAVGLLLIFPLPPFLHWWGKRESPRQSPD
jgi:hypothetical protein